MQEDFLHYIWKHKKFEHTKLVSTQGDTIQITSVGQHNFNAGPDFFNAQLKIADQFWAGNVEIHVKSSDWYLHNHEQDSTYDSVILHVVWEHDTEVFRYDNTLIPTLQLKDFISKDLLSNYKKLFLKTGKWIYCENDFASIDDFVIENWLERLYFERLERKAVVIQELLEATKNNWEAVLFIMLAKNFGLKVNGDSFYSIATSVDFSIIRKIQSNNQLFEALLFGQAGLLQHDIEDAHFELLTKDYQFLNQKFNLETKSVIAPQFFRLRPLNFPTIRLSQLANLYLKNQHLFSKIIETKQLEDYYQHFDVKASTYWDSHFLFGKTSKSSPKKLTKPFIDLLLINTILPIKFWYSKQNGRDFDTDILNIASNIASEKNTIIDAFNAIKKVATTSLHSQALIQLKTEYCNKNKCLQCAIGSQLLK